MFLHHKETLLQTESSPILNIFNNMHRKFTSIMNYKNLLQRNVFLNNSQATTSNSLFSNGMFPGIMSNRHYSNDSKKELVFQARVFAIPKNTNRKQSTNEELAKSAISTKDMDAGEDAFYIAEKNSFAKSIGVAGLLSSKTNLQPFFFPQRWCWWLE